MPDITLCTNKTCPLRDNCKRGVEYPKSEYQSYCHFQYGYTTCYKNYPYEEYEMVTCKFQLKING